MEKPTNMQPITEPEYWSSWDRLEPPSTDPLLDLIGDLRRYANSVSVHLETIEALTVGIQAQLQRVESLLDNNRAESARVLHRIQQIADRQDTHAFNLEQTRRLIETLVQRTDQLAVDVIDRHVTDPLFKEFVRLYAGVQVLSDATRPDEAKALAESIERFLDSCGLTFIQPREGDLLDPREHQPMQHRDTEDRKLGGRAASTYIPGLSNKKRRL